MQHSLKQIRRLALDLSYEERAKLSEELWWSLHPPGDDLSREEMDASWDAEIKRRIEGIDSGAVELIPGELVLAEMRRRLTKRSTK
jgi:putative addiction module component (TIGR02574 family)